MNKFIVYKNYLYLKIIGVFLGVCMLFFAFFYTPKVKADTYQGYYYIFVPLDGIYFRDSNNMDYNFVLPLKFRLDISALSNDSSDVNGYFEFGNYIGFYSQSYNLVEGVGSYSASPTYANNNTNIGVLLGCVNGGMLTTTCYTTITYTLIDNTLGSFDYDSESKHIESYQIVYYNFDTTNFVYGPSINLSFDVVDGSGNHITYAFQLKFTSSFRGKFTTKLSAKSYDIPLYWNESGGSSGGGGSYELGYSDGYLAGQNSFGTTSQDSYNNGYQAGYDDAEVFYSDFYNNTLDAVRSAAYASGYANGIEDPNNYTFKQLIFSTIDAPVKAFQGLFNFTFLGYNMLEFVEFLLTCALALAIVRVIMKVV